MIYTDVDEYLKRAEDSPQYGAGPLHGYEYDRPAMVATSGAFDIITPGHIKLFETMRRLGSFTVVLLNTDESIKQYKSPGRPVKEWQDRAVILDAMKHVDCVIGMAERDPILAVKKLKPQIWVKGNRAADTVVELPTIHGYGGVYVALWTPLSQSSTGYIQEAAVAYNHDIGPQQREASEVES